MALAERNLSHTSIGAIGPGWCTPIFCLEKVSRRMLLKPALSARYERPVMRRDIWRYRHRAEKLPYLFNRMKLEIMVFTGKTS